MIDFFKKKKKKEPENIMEVLEEFKKLKEEVQMASKKMEAIKEKNTSALQKIGIIRFNPFKDMGGNQSFSLALLDGRNTGLVISSLYTREGNRVYAKGIKEGRSEHPLSSEEKKAIEEALKNI